MQTDQILLYDQPVYDTVHIPITAAGAVNATLFTVPYGSTITGAVVKTIAQTNMIQAGRLEQGHRLEITGVSWHIPIHAGAGAAPTFADMKALRTCSFRLWIADKPFLEVPLCLIPGGGADGVYQSNIAAAATEWSYLNGNSVHQNRYVLAHPLSLEAGVSFKAAIADNVTAVAAPIWATVVLWGTHYRPAN